MLGIEPSPELSESPVRPLHHIPIKLVEPRGIEPLFVECHSAVLPLYDGPITRCVIYSFLRAYVRHLTVCDVFSVAIATTGFSHNNVVGRIFPLFGFVSYNKEFCCYRILNLVAEMGVTPIIALIQCDGYEPSWRLPACPRKS